MTGSDGSRWGHGAGVGEGTPAGSGGGVGVGIGEGAGVGVGVGEGFGDGDGTGVGMGVGVGVGAMTQSCGARLCAGPVPTAPAEMSQSPSVSGVVESLSQIACGLKPAPECNT